MRKRNHDTKPVPSAAENEVTVKFRLDEDDARELERHAKRLGVSVDTLLNEAAAIFIREVGREPPPPSTVEHLAKRGRQILRKRDLN